MRLSPTLSYYIGRQYLFWFAAMMTGLLTLVFLLDTVELSRRAAGRAGATLQVVVGMGLLKLPDIGQQIVPFGVLFGATYTFWRLTRSQELVVVRASGVSAWQFMAPVLIATVIVGIIELTLLNPIFAYMLSRYEQLENKYLKGQESSLDLSRTGVWLRQLLDVPDGNYIIHAESLTPGKIELHNVTILILNGDEGEIPVSRMDAPIATLDHGSWLLRDVWVNVPGRQPRHLDTRTLPTDMTENRIKESFAKPDTLSFWELSSYIQVLEKTGLSAVRHRMYYQSLWASPALLCAMVLLAGTFSLRHTRRGGTMRMVAAGAVTGLVLFVGENILSALGRTGMVPVPLAAWAPAFIALAVGIAALLHLEDG